MSPEPKNGKKKNNLKNKSDTEENSRFLNDEETSSTGDIFNWMLQNDQVSNLLPVN